MGLRKRHSILALAALVALAASCARGSANKAMLQAPGSAVTSVAAAGSASVLAETVQADVARGPVALAANLSGFSPNLITARPGERVILVITSDGAPHTFSITELKLNLDIKAREKKEFTFVAPAAAGDYKFFCEFHTNMVGTLRVAGAPVSSAGSAAAGSLAGASGANGAAPAASSAPAPAPAPGETRFAVAARMEGFSPASLSARAGAPVTISVTAPDRRHTLTFPTLGGASADVRPGETKVLPLGVLQPGSYPYLCDFHATMTGQLVVSGSAAASPSPPAGAAHVHTPAQPVTATPAAAPAPAPQQPLNGEINLTALTGGFSPSRLTAQAGSRLTLVVSAPDRRHTFTSTALGVNVDIPTGTTKRIELGPLAPGTYPFLCDFHDNMTGQLVVTGGGGPAPTPQPVPTPVPAPLPTPLPAPAPGAPAPGSKAVAVTALSAGFSPSQITAQAGQTLTLNISSPDKRHTFTAPGLGINVEIPAGSSKSIPVGPLAVGSYPFFCEFHDNMRGVITVTEPGTVAPAPGQTPVQPAPDPRRDDDDHSGHDDDDDDRDGDRSGRHGGRG